MVSKKFLFLATATIFFSGVLLVFVCPQIQYQKAREKYPLGISLDEVKRKTETRMILSEPAAMFPYTPTEAQLKETPFYTVYLPEESASLEFNFYKELITVRKLGHPFWQWIPVWAGGSPTRNF